MKSYFLCVASLLSVSADAAQLTPCLTELDRNGDRQLTLDEVRENPKLSALFIDLDKDKDGRLNADELRKFEAIYSTDSGLKRQLGS